MNRKSFVRTLLGGAGVLAITPVIGGNTTMNYDDGTYFESQFDVSTKRARERQINKELTFAVKKELEERGYKVVFHGPHATIKGNHRMACTRVLQCADWVDGEEMPVVRIADRILQSEYFLYSATLHMVGLIVTDWYHGRKTILIRSFKHAENYKGL